MGFGGDHQAWAFQVPAFAERYRVISVRQSGGGAEWCAGCGVQHAGDGGRCGGVAGRAGGGAGACAGRVDGRDDRAGGGAEPSGTRAVAAAALHVCAGGSVHAGAHGSVAEHSRQGHAGGVDAHRRAVAVRARHLPRAPGVRRGRHPDRARQPLSLLTHRLPSPGRRRPRARHARSPRHARLPHPGQRRPRRHPRPASASPASSPPPSPTPSSAPSPTSPTATSGKTPPSSTPCASTSSSSTPRPDPTRHEHHAPARLYREPRHRSTDAQATTARAIQRLASDRARSEPLP